MSFNTIDIVDVMPTDSTADILSQTFSTQDTEWADRIGQKVGQLQYLQMVLDEAMRLYCPVSPSHVGSILSDSSSVAREVVCRPGDPGSNLEANHV